MEDIPAFKAEKFLTAERNYLSRIDFELKQITKLDGYVQKYTRDWEDVDKELKTDKSIGIMQGRLSKPLNNKIRRLCLLCLQLFFY